MQEINAWLNSDKDFDTGSVLYQKYGTNSFFKKLLLSQGATKFNKKRLVAELTDLAPATPANTLDETKPAITETEPAPLISTEQEPLVTKEKNNDLENYLNVKEHNQTLYRQLERNMIELDLRDDQPFLFMTARNIKALHKKIMDNYKLIDHFDETGEFPKRIIITTKNVDDQIQLLRQSISKAKSRLKKEGCRDKSATELLIEENKKKILALGGTIRL